MKLNALIENLDLDTINEYIDNEVSLAKKYENYTNLEQLLRFVESQEYFNLLLGLKRKERRETSKNS
jgi:hypothetical protein